MPGETVLTTYHPDRHRPLDPETIMSDDDDDDDDDV